MSRAGPGGFEARVLATVAAIPADAIASARWSGLAGRAPCAVGLLDAFEFEDRGALAILAATLPDHEEALLTLPLADAPPWAGLHDLVARGGSVAGARGGRLVGRPGHPSPALSAGRPGHPSPALSTGRLAGVRSRQAPAIRPAPGDQSHTSVVLGEDAILKLYRRLTRGPNAEAEVLEALAADPSAPVPVWHGSVELRLPDAEATTVAIEQAFISGASDAFEVQADGLAVWLAGEAGPVSMEIAAATGLATGRLHAALARLGGPGFTPRPATPEERATWLRAAEATIEAAVRAVGTVDAELADRIRRVAPSVRRGLRPLGDPAIPVGLQRIHGDLHLGQVLPASDGVLIVDFEGDPTRDAVARRALAPPLRDVASFLRSLDHVARSGYRRAGARLGTTPGPEASAVLDGWISAVRRAFLEAYAVGVGDPAWTPDRALLRGLELEKELGEFVYAGTFLPDWLYAPTGGLRALVRAMAEADAEVSA